MGRRSIAGKIVAGEVQISRHAYDQMIAREIYIKQIHDVLLNGRVVGRWKERGGEKLAIVGDRFNGDRLKVIILDRKVPKVITVCYPD